MSREIERQHPEAKRWSDTKSDDMVLPVVLLCQKELMEFHELVPDETARIGEVNREESVNAVLIVRQDASIPGFSTCRIKKSPPIEIGSWGIQGTLARVKSWKPVLDQGGFFYGSFDKNRLVGFVILGSKREDCPGVLEALFVDGKYRRTGIAQTLLASAEQKTRELKMESIVLRSNATESAACFYLKSGFSVTGANLSGKGMAKDIPGDIPMKKRISKASPITSGDTDDTYQSTR